MENNKKKSIAEDTVSSIASISFTIGSVILAIVFIIGIKFVEEESQLGLICIVAIVLFIPLLFRWATTKLFVNISKNLFDIRNSMAKMEKELDELKKKE